MPCDIGARAKSLREAADKTQQWLVNRSGLSLSTIHRIENSDYDKLELDTIHALAKALDISKTELAEWLITWIAWQLGDNFKLLHIAPKGDSQIREEDTDTFSKLHAAFERLPSEKLKKQLMRVAQEPQVLAVTSAVFDLLKKGNAAP